MKKFTTLIAMMSIMLMLFAGNAFASSAAGAKSDAQSGAEANNNQTFEAGDRAFPIGQAINYAPLPGFFGDNNKPGHQFMSLKKILMYNTIWEIEKAAKMAKGAKGNVHNNLAPLVDPVKQKDRPKTVICTMKAFDSTKVEIIELAYGTVNATNKKVISAHDFAEALLAAAEYGATHIQFLAEGTNTELSSFGWGFGFNHTEANSSSLSTGGTGVSGGSAGYNNLPWQQFVLLKVIVPNAIATISADIIAEDIVEHNTIVDSNVDKAVKNSTVK